MTKPPKPSVELHRLAVLEDEGSLNAIGPQQIPLRLDRQPWKRNHARDSSQHTRLIIHDRRAHGLGRRDQHRRGNRDHKTRRQNENRFALVVGECAGCPPNPTPEEKRELLEKLKQLGADARGIFSKAVEVDIKQTQMPGEANLYEKQYLHSDREISKAWLGMCSMRLITAWR